VDFEDVENFDTTHKTNLYDKPLAIFVGASHHLQNTIFGCALLGDETMDAFEWVFRALKKCMGINRTRCILTGKPLNLYHLPPLPVISPSSLRLDQCQVESVGALCIGVSNPSRPLSQAWPDMFPARTTCIALVINRFVL
jgi:hypothetical protein